MNTSNMLIAGRKIARLWLLGVLGLCAASGAGLIAQPELRFIAEEQPQPPPPAPPGETRELAQHLGSSGGSPTSPTNFYSIGEPSDEEQLYLEYLNRARANPAAEALRLSNTLDPAVLNAYRYFGVDQALMVSQITALSPVPPLSMNARLLNAARLHDQDMLANDFQGHTGSDGSSPGARLTGQGYLWTRYGENVYASAKSVFYGHAGFEVDWGYGTGGMQSPPGHRRNIHNPDYREVGVGVVRGTGTSVGPQLVTQDFADRAGSTPFITGVAYYDLNGNGQYDAGEGIGGVQVSAPGATAAALTVNAGGYSIPVPGNGPYTVSFSAPGLAPFQASVNVSQNQNVKLDFAPAYRPPAILGPDPTAPPGPGLRYRFSAVGAATAYQWTQSRRVPYAETEGAEQGVGTMLPATSGDYPVTVNNVNAAGSSSFHLVHTRPADQSLTLNRLLRPGPSSQLIFASRLGWATSNQVAQAELSTNGGSSWLNLWSCPGTGNSGQTAFTRITNDLSTFASQEIILRFVYQFSGGTYYPGSNTGTGWYLDEIGVNQAEELADAISGDVPTGTSFDFAPAQAGDFVLRIRPQVGGRWLDWGPAFLANSSAASMFAVRINGPPALVGGRVEFEFELENGVESTFEIETAPSPAGPWRVDPSASLQEIVPGTTLRVQLDRGPGRICFYRIVAHPL